MSAYRKAVFHWVTMLFLRIGALLVLITGAGAYLASKQDPHTPSDYLWGIAFVIAMIWVLWIDKFPHKPNPITIYPEYRHNVPQHEIRQIEGPAQKRLRSPESSSSRDLG